MNKHALITTLLSILIGIFYFIYISNVSFPPSLSRIVPFILLAGAGMGLKMSNSMTLRIIGIANVILAGVFALGALMGD
ncbi:MAG: hypothetical protein V4576_00930 [Patescibacteria group bacterium]